MHVGSMFRAGIAVAAVLLVTYAGPAGAHGDLLGGTPIPGSTVASAPARVRLTFSERPGRQSSMLVRDGCQRDVTRRVSRDDNALVASNRTGQPGEWTVEYAIVTDDGHAVTASTNFQVSGSKDCNAPQANDDQSAPPATSDGSATSGQDAAASGSSDGTSPWLITLGAAAGLIIAGAVTARLLMRREGGASAGRPGS